jgi:5-methylcytosine-specific restriction endonuclease McrA
MADFIHCEVCNSKAVDIHHIECRGMGGSNEKDKIENLQALCRSCHIKYGDNKEYKEMLNSLHKLKLVKSKLY